MWIRMLAIAVLAAGAARAQELPEGGDCQLPLSSGRHTVAVVQNGLSRPLTLYVPAGYAGQPIPLLFLLHGSAQTGDQILAARDPSGRPIFTADADANGYAIAAPSGAVPFSPAPGFTGFAWNIPGVPLVGTTFYPPAGTPDDVQYIDLAIDAISDTICIDPRRVYATGASGGGRMASQLACDLSDRIAAVAPIMGIRAPTASDTPPHTVECEPLRPVPVAAIHGLLDPVNVFADGDPRIVPGSSWTYGAPEAARRWAALNGCIPEEPKVTAVTPHIELWRYRDCAANGDVWLYAVEDGGHTIPGTAVIPALVPLIGPTNQEIDAAQVIWSFLRKHKLHD